VFISEKRFNQDKTKDRAPSVLVAEKGHQEVQADGNRYLVLENGYRYDGNPGRPTTVRSSTTPTACCCPSRKSPRK
jgi:lipopolysaccharide export LptBFGC system permease protein LptF